MVRERRRHRLMGRFSSPRRSVRRHITVSLIYYLFFQGVKISGRYFYPGSAFVITELDGVKIVGPDVCDLIQKVPGTHYGR